MQNYQRLKLKNLVFFGLERRRLARGGVEVSVNRGCAGVFEEDGMAGCEVVIWLLAVCGTLYGRLGIG